MEEEGRKGQSDVMWEGLDPPLLVLKMDDWGLKPQEYEQPAEIGKEKEMDSPLAPPKGNAAEQHLDFGPVRLMLDFWLTEE